MNPFDYVNSINHSKKDLMIGEDEEKAYPPFLVNRSLSYFQDTVLLANEMNKCAHIDNRMQYDFLKTAVRPRKRFSKWHKKTSSDRIDIIKAYYGYSDAKAQAISDLISEATLKEMKEILSKGGKTK
jgi:hypothetical protein